MEKVDWDVLLKQLETFPITEHNDSIIKKAKARLQSAKQRVENDPQPPHLTSNRSAYLQVNQRMICEESIGVALKIITLPKLQRHIRKSILL